MNRSLKLHTSDRKPFVPTFALLGSMLFVVSSALAAENWTAATPHPTDIIRYAFAQDGEDFYVISGVSSGSVVKAVRRYNATTNVWTSLADIPVGSRSPAAVFYGGKIYVADGGTAKFRIYDIATDTWSLGPHRPGVSSSYGAAAGAFNGKIYIAGGDTVNTYTVSIYNIATNTWSDGLGAPSRYILGGYAQIGQFLYLIGSWQGSATHSNVSKRLDMATNTWSNGPAWTPQRAFFALAAAGTKLFALGGKSGAIASSAQVDELETSTWPAGVWTPSPDNLPSPREPSAGFFSTGRAGGEIWCTGSGSPGLDHIFRPVSIPCQDYIITESTRSLVPATTDIGNHCEACVTAITFPFPVKLYGTNYTSAKASSNGNLQFNSGSTSSDNSNSLPAGGFNATIFAFWDNLRTNAAGDGIFTSVTGTAPNRVFTIEWRVSRSGGSATSNFEIRLSEGSPDFEIVYGATTGDFTGTIGVQRDGTLSTQFFGGLFESNVPPAGTRLLFTTSCCAPIAFNGAIGSNSDTYPGSSGVQTGRVLRDGNRSACGTQKDYSGTADAVARTYDRYSFTNPGPATCVTFSVNSACTSTQSIYPVAYLGSFNSSNIATNYLGDPGAIASAGFNSFSVDVPANSTVVLVVHEMTAGGACPSYDVVVTGLNCPLELTGAVSRKAHGAAGEFNIPLPLTGQPGVECRSGGGGGNHKLVFTFNTEVTSGNATVIAGAGSAGAPIFLGKTMTVPLSGVTDMQKITVRLNGVTDTLSRVLPNTPVSMNVLLGDTTASKTVNASDIGQTKSKSGQAVSAANFRNDTTVSGSINASDIGQVKANSGHAVP